MPLQHFNAEMLKRMARRVDPQSTRELVHRLRERIDNLVIRTTFITGFPGETDEQFNDMVTFVQGGSLRAPGVFTYSLEPDYAAAKLPNHLPDDVKNARRDRLMESSKVLRSSGANVKLVARSKS